MKNKIDNIIKNYAVGLVFTFSPEENAYELLMNAKNEKEFNKLDFSVSEEFEYESFNSLKKIVNEKVSDLELFLKAVEPEIKQENKDDMKKIRLEWTSDTRTFEDILVQKDYSDNEIEDSINLALALHDDEVNQFIEISHKKGYKAQIYTEDIDVYSFESNTNEDYEQMSTKELKQLINSLETKEAATNIRKLINDESQQNTLKQEL